MKNLYKSLALATALSAAASMPAQAQVAGIATSSPEAVMVQSQARQAAYQQINTTYATQIQQVTALRNEINTLQQSLDTNGDRQVDQQEIAAQSAVVQQIEQKQQQADTATNPIALAQYYVIEQLLGRYGDAQQQVINSKNIQIMLTPEAFQYAADGANVTPDILAALNALVPTVTATPPANYQPRRETVAMHQAVQQVIVAAAQRAAIQQAQQQGASQAPTGR